MCEGARGKNAKKRGGLRLYKELEPRRLPTRLHKEHGRAQSTARCRVDIAAACHSPSHRLLQHPIHWDADWTLPPHEAMAPRGVLSSPATRRGRLSAQHPRSFPSGTRPPPPTCARKLCESQDEEASRCARPMRCRRGRGAPNGLSKAPRAGARAMWTLASLANLAPIPLVGRGDRPCLRGGGGQTRSDRHSGRG